MCTRLQRHCVCVCDWSPSGHLHCPYEMLNDYLVSRTLIGPSDEVDVQRAVRFNRGKHLGND